MRGVEYEGPVWVEPWFGRVGGVLPDRLHFPPDASTSRDQAHLADFLKQASNVRRRHPATMKISALSIYCGHTFVLDSNEVHGALTQLAVT
jgi:hypothetical protein